MNTAIAPPPAHLARIPAQAPDPLLALPTREPGGAPVTRGNDPPPLDGAEAVAAADLRALMLAFPVGSRLRFHSYHPAIWPRDWRRAAEQAAWGLRQGDLLGVTGFGEAIGFPDALLARRIHDGTTAMIFPPEVEPVEPAGSPSTVPSTVQSTGAAGTTTASAAVPRDGDGRAGAAQRAQHVRAAQDWADDGGRS